MVDQGGGSKATERTLSVLPLEKRAALATVLVAIAFACQQTVSGGLYAFNRYALSFGCGESPAMFPSGLQTPAAAWQGRRLDRGAGGRSELA